MDMPYISFPVGTTFVLVIDTDKYSGNFERELCGYVTGVYDKERYHGEAQANLARKEVPDFVKSMRCKIALLSHDEYGLVSNSIRSTPQRSNDGYGLHHDSKPEEKAFPAYESLAIFMRTPPTPEEMDIIRSRMAAYCSQNSIGVRDIYMAKVEQAAPVETRLDV